MKFRISYFAKPSAPGVMPALLAAPTGDFGTVDDARKAAVSDADNPKIGPVDSIIIEPIGERWVKGEHLVRTGGGWIAYGIPNKRRIGGANRAFDSLLASSG